MMRLILETTDERVMSDTSTQARSIRERLTVRGIRYTSGRQAVVGELQASGGPLSAAEIGDRLSGQVPVSSLYRSLAVLEEVGVLQTYHAGGGVTRYELAEWLNGHHHHLVCMTCGRVEDMEISASFEQRLDGLAREVASDSGFRPTGHTLEIEGRCRFCVDRP